MSSAGSEPNASNDAISMLARDLSVAHDTLHDPSIITAFVLKDIVSAEDSLVCSSRMIEDKAHVFHDFYGTLIRQLFASRLINEELNADMEKRVDSGDLRVDVNIEHSDVISAWQGFSELEQRISTHNAISLTRDNADESCDLALQLCLATDWLVSASKIIGGYYDRLDYAYVVLRPPPALNADVLSVIFELVAEYEAPSRSSLGWMRLSHVCGTWRQVLFSLSNLWARDAYVFEPTIAANYLLPRGRDALLSVSPSRFPSADPREIALGNEDTVRFESEEDLDPVRIRASKGLLRDLNVTVVCKESRVAGSGSHARYLLQGLEAILQGKPQPDLRSVIIWALGDFDIITNSDEAVLPMGNHPNLRHIQLVNTFIPFSLSTLVSLHVVNDPRRESPTDMPQTWFDALLDSLRACQGLIDLRIIGWNMPPPSDPRVITLARVHTFCCTDDDTLDLFDLPALQRGCIFNGRGPEGMRRALDATFSGRYGPAPLSMQLSQRVARDSRGRDQLILRFGREGSCCPPPLAFDPEPLWAEPGPFITIAKLVSPEDSARALSDLFPSICDLIREVRPETQALETIGFDNETRETSFAAQTTMYQIMALPSFPSVKTIELPLADHHSICHIICSLALETNPSHLPMLGCLRFIRPLNEADNFEVAPLASLLRARVSEDTTPITSIEFKLLPDELSQFLGTASIVPLGLKCALAKAVDNGLGEHASLAMKEEIAFDSPTKVAHIRLIGTITY